MKNYGLFAVLGLALALGAGLQAASDNAYRDQNGKHFKDVAGGDLYHEVMKSGVPAIFPAPGARTTYHVKS